MISLKYLGIKICSKSNECRKKKVLHQAHSKPCAEDIQKLSIPFFAVIFYSANQILCIKAYF